MNKNRNQSHTIWHHVAMVAYMEVKSVMLLAVGFPVVVLGVFIFQATNLIVIKVAVGLPVVLMGVALELIKLHDIVLALVRPKRIRAVCIFCREGNGQE